MYAKFFKRFFDFVLSLFALVVLSPILVVLTIVGAITMKGNPFFTQLRPGKINPKTNQERIFRLIKFRTMTCETDENGKLLPDEDRLTGYGKWLRSTSLDELPELINILIGDMSIVGPRPQLVRDMVFMNDEQRKRHSVRQGLTGLAQVSGRNNISWEKKFEYDLQYIEKITLLGDIKIIFATVFKVLKSEDVATDGMETAEDFGDYLYRRNLIDEDRYDQKMCDAVRILEMASKH